MGKGIQLDGVTLQPIQSEKSSIFVDNIWDVPTILDSQHHRVYAEIVDIPAMGYKTLEVKPFAHALQKKDGIAHGNILENSVLRATVNANGTIDVLYKKTGKLYRGLNFYTSQGEVGNAWKHTAPEFDRKYSTIGERHRIYVTESGELSGSVVTECEFEIPESCAVSWKMPFITPLTKYDAREPSASSVGKKTDISSFALKTTGWDCKASTLLFKKIRRAFPDTVCIM